MHTTKPQKKERAIFYSENFMRKIDLHSFFMSKKISKTTFQVQISVYLNLTLCFQNWLLQLKITWSLAKIRAAIVKQSYFPNGSVLFQDFKQSLNLFELV